MPPTPPTDLQTVTHMMQPYVQFSLNHFIPETILTAGFLIAIVLDLFIRDKSAKRLTAYFALIVLAAAGYTAWQQWVPFVANHNWEGGKLIFPYSQTLFAPRMDGAVNMVAGYGMMVVDNFAVFFKLLVALCAIFIILMSLISREIGARRSRFGEYYSLLLAMALGMFLMPASTDLIMMYISLELVSITSYILAGFMKGDKRSTESSMKYVLFGAFSSGLMIYGFSIIYGLTGTTNIMAIHQILQLSVGAAGHVQNSGALWLATILALAGMGYKISAAPFHFWTPDVYEGAPIPITALLSVASKAGGFGMLLRFLLFTFPMNPATNLPIINWPFIIAVISALTMTLGNFAALQQQNIKRMLAYSTIAHAGYMLIGVVVAGSEVASIGMGRGLGDPGIVSVLIYFVAYLFMNLGAFYAVMLIENSRGVEDIDHYRGLARKSPLLAVSLTIFLISLTGIPLTIGFIGKLYLFTAVMQANPVTHQVTWLWLGVVAILNSVVSLYYYVRVMAAMFIKDPLNDFGENEGLVLNSRGGVTLAGNGMALRVSSGALLFAFLIPVLFFGVYFQPVVSFAENVIRFLQF